jgi:hypothetical protein
MKKVLTAFFLLLLVGSLPLVAKSKSRNWQTGRIIDYQESEWVNNSGGKPVGGTEGAGALTANPVWATEERHPRCEIILDAGDYTYHANRILCASVCKCPAITKNVETKYVIEKDSLIVLDDKGKEFKMQITDRQQNKTPKAVSQDGK